MKDDGFAERYPRLLHVYRFLPNLKRPGMQNPIINRLHEMATQAKHILGESVEREKPLSLSRGGKPTPVTFPWARGFVRYFRTIVGVNVIEVFYGRHHRTMNSIIAM